MVLPFLFVLEEGMTARLFFGCCTAVALVLFVAFMVSVVNYASERHKTITAWCTQHTMIAVQVDRSLLCQRPSDGALFRPVE